MAVVLLLLACTVLLAGSNTSSESNEEQPLKVYSFSGEENTYQVQLKTTEITKEVKK